MRLGRFFSVAILVLVSVLMIFSGGCFSSTGGETTATDKTTALKPTPVVDSVIATTSGTEGAYYAILDIKVKNKGAEGTILVVASITQNSKTQQDEMPVYLKQNEVHELKLTFPLVWKGGEWNSNVHTQVP